jgi:hypothetical protein
MAPSNQSVPRSNQQVHKTVRGVIAGVHGTRKVQKRYPIGRNSEVDEAKEQNGAARKQRAGESEAFQRQSHVESSFGYPQKAVWIAPFYSFRDAEELRNSDNLICKKQVTSRGITLLMSQFWHQGHAKLHDQLPAVMVSVPGWK